MRKMTIVILIMGFLILACIPCFSGANNNTPQDTFETYQKALRANDVNLLLQVYHFPNPMTEKRLLSELQTLKKYDGYKNYSIIMVLDQKEICLLKVKGTLGSKENVKRTFQVRRFNTGWKITKVSNS